MAIFKIDFDHLGSHTVFADTVFDAICHVAANHERPIYCRIHDGMAPERCTANPGEMGQYYPKPIGRLLSVTPMREVYMGGGYCVVPLAA